MSSGFAFPVLQVGMDHAALDRTGPHDRHLDDEIVVGPRRGAAASFICARLSTWNTPTDRPCSMSKTAGSSASMPSVTADRGAIADQLEVLAQAGQHAEPQHVDLEDLQDVEIVLVPFDDGAVRPWPRSGSAPARRAGRRSGRSRRHAATGGGETAQLAPTARAPAARRGSVGSRPASRTWSTLTPLDPAPDRVGQRAHHVGRQAERLADLADGAAAAIGDHRRGQPGLGWPAVLAIDVLDHPPRAAHARNRRRCRAARRVDEALEQEVGAAVRRR